MDYLLIDLFKSGWFIFMKLYFKYFFLLVWYDVLNWWLIKIILMEVYNINIVYIVYVGWIGLVI